MAKQTTQTQQQTTVEQIVTGSIIGSLGLSGAIASLMFLKPVDALLTAGGIGSISTSLVAHTVKPRKRQLGIYSPEPATEAPSPITNPPTATPKPRVAVSSRVPVYVERDIKVDPSYQPKPISGTSLAIELLEAELAEKQAEERSKRQQQLEEYIAASEPATAPIEAPKPEQDVVEPSAPRTSVERAIIKAIRKRTKQGKPTTLRDLVGLAFAKKHDLRASGDLRAALEPLLADGTLYIDNDQYRLN